MKWRGFELLLKLMEISRNDQNLLDIISAYLAFLRCSASTYFNLLPFLPFLIAILLPHSTYDSQIYPFNFRFIFSRDVTLLKM